MISLIRVAPWLKRFYAGAPVFCCAALALIILSGQDASTKRITCTEIAIENRAEGQFAFIDARGLYFLDGKGKVEIGRTPDGLPFLRLSAPRGPRVEIGMDGATWRIAIGDEGAGDRITIGTGDEGRAGIVISDGLPRVEIMVAKKAGPASLTVNDQDGRERVRVGVDEQPFTRLIDEKGRVIWRRP